MKNKDNKIPGYHTESLLTKETERNKRWLEYSTETDESNESFNDSYTIEHEEQAVENDKTSISLRYKQNCK